MTLAERIAKEEDRRAGRVMPGWRFYTSFIVAVATALLVRWVLDDFGFWWSLIPSAVGCGAYAALLGRYKMRTLR